MAKTGNTGLLGKIVGLSIGMYFLSYIFAPALLALAGVNTTGLSAAEIALFAVISIVVILAIVVVILREVGVHI